MYIHLVYIEVKVPERLEFYELWARHASLDVSELLKTLAAPSFWLTAANAAVISALTAVMNVFGTASAAQIQVDMDREMRLHGAYNVCSGLLSGLNANMARFSAVFRCFQVVSASFRVAFLIVFRPGRQVMSFSITCRTLGADGRQFQAGAPCPGRAQVAEHLPRSNRFGAVSLEKR